METNTGTTNAVSTSGATENPAPVTKTPGIKGRKPAVNAILTEYLRNHAARITEADFAAAAATLAEARQNPKAYQTRQPKEKTATVAAPVTAPEVPASQTVTVTTDVA